VPSKRKRRAFFRRARVLNYLQQLMRIELLRPERKYWRITLKSQ
jgi:hypothetical protein